MADMMEYPKTPNEFIKSYSFKDSDEIYTNGDELVPVFRVEQMLEHYYEQQKISLENKTSDNMNSSCSCQVWIPVSEKEPSKYGVYLVSGHIHRKQKEHIRVAEYFGKFEVANNFVVTAWQPLPKPYKSER